MAERNATKRGASQDSEEGFSIAKLRRRNYQNRRLADK